MRILTVHEAHRLNELEEACGKLLRVSKVDGFTIAVFAWGEIALPADMAGKLSELVGRRVGIIRLDGYRVRAR